MKPKPPPCASLSLSLSFVRKYNWNVKAAKCSSLGLSAWVLPCIVALLLFSQAEKGLCPLQLLCDAVVLWAKEDKVENQDILWFRHIFLGKCLNGSTCSWDQNENSCRTHNASLEHWHVCGMDILILFGAGCRWILKPWEWSWSLFRHTCTKLAQLDDTNKLLGKNNILSASTLGRRLSKFTKEKLHVHQWLHFVMTLFGYFETENNKNSFSLTEKQGKLTKLQRRDPCHFSWKAKTEPEG